MNLHLLSLIRDKNVLADILSKLKTKEIYMQDSVGNNILHYATHFRNLELTELLIGGQANTTILND
jgi:ankyrin repeat protein